MIRSAFFAALVIAAVATGGCAEKQTVATDSDSLKAAAAESVRIAQEEGGEPPLKANKKKN